VMEVPARGGISHAVNPALVITLAEADRSLESLNGLLQTSVRFIERGLCLVQTYCLSKCASHASPHYPATTTAPRSSVKALSRRRQTASRSSRPLHPSSGKQANAKSKSISPPQAPL